MRRRPKLISDNKVRQSKHQKPEPPSSRGMINQEMEGDDQNETEKFIFTGNDHNDGIAY
jgi:spore germination protein KA